MSETQPSIVEVKETKSNTKIAPMSVEIESPSKASNDKWYQKIKWRETIGWSFNDFSNSIYITVIVSAIYAPYFVDYVAKSGVAASLWSVANIVPTIFSILVTPVIGSIIDLKGHKLAWVGAHIVGYSIFSALLYFVRPYSEHNHTVIAIVLLILGRIAYNTNEGVCAMFLPDCVVDRKYSGFVSGIGWGIGYVGGTIGLGILTFGVMKDEDDPGYADSVSLSMLLCGLFCLISGIPVIYGLWKVPSKNTITIYDSVELKDTKLTTKIWEDLKDTFKQLWNTLKVVMKKQDLRLFFLAFLIYMIGVQGIVSFMSIYASDTIDLSAGQIATMFVIIQITAAIGCVLFGYIENYLGPKIVIIITLIIWTVGLILAVSAIELCEALNWNVKTFFICICPIVGVAMGPSQSCSRSMLTLLSPKDLSGEIFSLWEMFVNLASIISTIYGPISDATDGRTAACIFCGTFPIGLFILIFVKLERGKRVAQIWEDELSNAQQSNKSSDSTTKKDEKNSDKSSDDEEPTKKSPSVIKEEQQPTVSTLSPI